MSKKTNKENAKPTAEETANTETEKSEEPNSQEQAPSEETTADDFVWEEYWDIMSHSPKKRLVAKK